MKKLLAFVFAIYAPLSSAFPPIGVIGQSGTSNLYPTVYKVPYSQVSNLGGGKAIFETGSENMLINPGFEAYALLGWTCTTGTCTVETTVFSSGLQSAKIVPTSNVFDFSQTVNTPANIQKQGVVGIVYNFPATCQTATINTKIDGAIQTTVPTSSFIYDGTFHQIEIPITFGATSAGMQVYAGSSCTGNIYLDAAYIKQGIGLQNLMTDNNYSAQSSASGVVSGLNKAGWLSGNCVVTNTAQYDCSIATGLVSSKLNCNATINHNDFYFFGVSYDYSNSSNTNLRFRTFNSSSGAATVTSFGFSFSCQKSGNDYLASSSNVYSQAGANYDWTAFTPIFSAGLGTVTSPNCYHQRIGSNLNIRCKFTTGTVAASVATLTLPNSLTTSSTLSTYEQVGSVAKGNSIAIVNNVIAAPSSATINFSGQGAANNSLTAYNGNDIFTSTTAYSIQASIPIQGWSNSNVIVGSFAGVPTVPGLNGATDTFSITYGTTNFQTICSASPCLVDQIGSAVSSITRTSAGAYSLNTSKTYTKLKCSITPMGNTNFLGAQYGSCSSCNALAFYTGVATSQVDSYGTILCQGQQ